MDQSISKNKFNNKQTLIYAGIALCTTAFLGLSYFIYKQIKKPKLNPWLEEYIQEIHEKINKFRDNPTNKGKDLPPQIVANIYHLLQNTQDYLFTYNNAELEQDRIDALGNNEEYEALIYETMEAQDKYYNSTLKVIESRLNVNFEDLKKTLQNLDKKIMTDLIQNDQKAYDNLPEITSQDLKKAYLFYHELVKRNVYSIQNQLAMIKKNPEYEETAMKVIFTNKYILQDTIKKKFNLEEKHLNQLVKDHDLLVDGDVRKAYEEIKLLDIGFM